jgi:prevent-host-death family protein
MAKTSNEVGGVRRATMGPKTRWQLLTAKARFSEVFRRARAEGPQLITRQGKEGVVTISDDQYNELVRMSHQPASLLEFFRASPLVGLELDFKRDKEQSREVL